MGIISNHVILTMPEIAYLAHHCGFDDVHNGPYIVAGVAFWYETEGQTGLYRLAINNPLGGNDTGIVQINDKAWPTDDPFDRFDPIINLYEARVRVYARQGWDAWKSAATVMGRMTEVKAIVGSNPYAIENSPYWKLKDAGMNVHDLPVPPIRPYVSAIPQGPLRIGMSGPAVGIWQRFLRDHGLYPRPIDSYFGFWTRGIPTLGDYRGPQEPTGTYELGHRLSRMNLWSGFAPNGEYSIYMRQVLDGALQFSAWHLRRAL